MERVLEIMWVILFTLFWITWVALITIWFIGLLSTIHNNEDEIERWWTAVRNYVSEKYNNFVEEYWD